MKATTGFRVWRSLAQVVAFAVFVNAFLYQAPRAVGAEAAPAPIRVVAFGDSLTAGFMLRPEDAFPVQLQKALTERGWNVEIVNAGVSGDTSAAGLDRLAWAIPEGTEAVILELGANDALRGIDPKTTRTNLTKIIAELNGRGIDVLLAGMKAPTNWGEAYAGAFDAIYPELAKANGLILYPFFLDGVALERNFNLDDGMHPNPKGVTEIVNRMLPSVEELLARVKARRAAAAKT